MMFLGIVIGVMLGAGFTLWFLEPRLRTESEASAEMANARLRQIVASQTQKIFDLKAKLERCQPDDMDAADWWKRER